MWGKNLNLGESPGNRNRLLEFPACLCNNDLAFRGSVECQAGPRLSRSRARPLQRGRDMFSRCGRNIRVTVFLLILVFIQTGCGLVQPTVPTATRPPAGTPAPTLTPTLPPTSAPTSTATPVPTATLEPSPTPIPLPAGISDVVSNASVIYQDTFNYSFLSPSGWSACSGFEPVWKAENNHLVITAQAGKYGTVFYYADKMIDPNLAVYFLFAYEGNQGSFTLGFDGYSNGKVCDSNQSKMGFYSVALQHMAGLPLTVHTIVVTDQPTAYFTGDWRLQEDNWYSALMGFDKSNTFFIDIWKPGDPSQKLVFKQTKADFPKTYNFISWLAVTRKLMIDDFTIVKFDEIK
jgi:hypothetical protein